MPFRWFLFVVLIGSGLCQDSEELELNDLELALDDTEDKEINHKNETTLNIEKTQGEAQARVKEFEEANAQMEDALKIRLAKAESVMKKAQESAKAAQVTLTVKETREDEHTILQTPYGKFQYPNKIMAINATNETASDVIQTIRGPDGTTLITPFGKFVYPFNFTYPENGAALNPSLTNLNLENEDSQAQLSDPTFLQQWQNRQPLNQPQWQGQQLQPPNLPQWQNQMPMQNTQPQWLNQLQPQNNQPIWQNQAQWPNQQLLQNQPQLQTQSQWQNQQQWPNQQQWQNQLPWGGQAQWQTQGLFGQTSQNFPGFLPSNTGFNQGLGQNQPIYQPGTNPSFFGKK